MASPDPDYERFVARDYRGPCLLHCSPTSLQRLDTAFRTSTRRRLPQLTYFGAQSHSLHTRCLRFTTWVTPMLRKTRFRPVASLYRAGLATRWVPLQGFSNASSLLPPCPSFPGARGLKYDRYNFSILFNDSVCLPNFSPKASRRSKINGRTNLWPCHLSSCTTP